ncbi:hypothetical protein D3C73_1161980 [compost metagenome]
MGDIILFTEKMNLVFEAHFFDFPLNLRQIRTFSNKKQSGRYFFIHLTKNIYNISNTLNWSKVRNMHQHFFIRFGKILSAFLSITRIIYPLIYKIVCQIYFSCNIQYFNRFLH